MSQSFLKYSLGFLWLAVAAGAEPVKRSFVFAAELASSHGVLQSKAMETYAPERGYGFEPGLQVKNVAGGVVGSPALYFTTDLPEGDWRVKVTVRGAPGGGLATVKAELRRLVLGPVRLAEGRKLEQEFIVNTRSHRIAARNGVAEGVVKLKAPRETTQEAWAWDDRLTLEVQGAVLAALEITPAKVPTVFLLGDSTVCDQSKEPYNSWGQMLTRFFKPTVAVANHGESGETYRDSIGRRRLDKVISVMQPGDYLFMQFGHNDQKQIAAGTGGPSTTYVEEMKRHIAAVRKVGGVPVVVSPMERRNFDAAGKLVPSLADYAKAARETAAAEHVAFIDLNAMSQSFYAALGPEASAQAFAAPGGKVDNTHHNNYGSYELARCVARGIVETNLPLASELIREFRKFDPAKPDNPATFLVPASPNFTNQRPLGD
ncbi:MAG TPA: rhamnogalacturonan acetylesterase [Lacunisphaera sp.]|nr:rhamnogalacturonan acetylesterase [Lacunisphaera sp.]